MYLCAYQSLVDDDFFEFVVTAAKNEKDAFSKIAEQAKKELEKEIESIEAQIKINGETKLASYAKSLKSRRGRGIFMKAMPIMGLSLASFVLPNIEESKNGQPEN